MPGILTLILIVSSTFLFDTFDTIMCHGIICRSSILVTQKYLRLLRSIILNLLDGQIQLQSYLSWIQKSKVFLLSESMSVFVGYAIPSTIFSVSTIMELMLCS